MNSFREEIISQLKTDLLNITTTNGYDVTIKSVVPKQITLKDVTQYPTAYFNFGNESATSSYEDSSYENLVLDLNLVIFVQANTDIKNEGLLTIEAEKVIKSISKFFYRDADILATHKCRFWSIETDDSNLINLHISQRTPYLDHENNVGAIQFIIKIEYQHFFN